MALLSQGAAIGLTIGIIAFLLVVFFVSFLVYRKTPAPKGCERIRPDEGACKGCSQVGCDLYGEYHKGDKDDGKEDGKKEEKK